MPLEFSCIHEEIRAAILNATYPEVDAEGARYSGKTWMVCATIIEDCLKWPGIEWLACRYSNEETRTKVKTEFDRIASLHYQLQLEWDDSESCFRFPSQGGQQSKVYCYGLKAQSIVAALSKVRGLGVASIWNDQSEELPQEIADELPFGTRQPGYPHRVVFSPNPPDEDHYIADRFPEENPFPHRRYFRLSVYDNAHNLAPGKLAELEANFPVTHSKYKSLLLGMRGPTVTGTPVYSEAFHKVDAHGFPQHVIPVPFDPNTRLLEAIESGKHHPVWIAAQRSYYGGWNILGGVMGKRMILEDFIPIVNKYRSEWFDDPRNVKTCCDPPPANEAANYRYSHPQILRSLGVKPTFRNNGNAPDVREAVIQTIAGHMKRRDGSGESFRITDDPKRWVMVSSVVTKQSKFFLDGLESNYVWDEHLISVANKKVRQPKYLEWTEGGMRCLENIVLNFGASQKSDAEKDDQRRRQREEAARHVSSSGTWLGT